MSKSDKFNQKKPFSLQKDSLIQSSLYAFCKKTVSPEKNKDNINTIVDKTQNNSICESNVEKSSENETDTNESTLNAKNDNQSNNSNDKKPAGKKRKKVEDLFGEDSDDDFQNGKLVILENKNDNNSKAREPVKVSKRNLDHKEKKVKIDDSKSDRSNNKNGNVKINIAEVVVKRMTPYFKGGKISTKILFKMTARKIVHHCLEANITGTLFNFTYCSYFITFHIEYFFADEQAISEFLKNIFNNTNFKIQDESDIQQLLCDKKQS